MPTVVRYSIVLPGLKLWFNLAEWDVFAELKFDQILLPIDDFECAWKKKKKKYCHHPSTVRIWNPWNQTIWNPDLLKVGFQMVRFSNGWALAIFIWLNVKSVTYLYFCKDITYFTKILYNQTIVSKLFKHAFLFRSFMYLNINLHFL